MKCNEDPRKYKFLCVTLHQIVELVCSGNALGDVYAIDRIQLPNDVTAVTAHFDVDMHCFKILLKSESFPEIPVGAQIPEIDYCRYGLLRIKLEMIPELRK